MFDSYEAKYGAMRAAAVKVEGSLFQRLVAACQKNDWLKIGGAEFEPEGFCCEHDYPYYLERYDDLEMLQRFFEHGNWGIRAGVQYQDLIFVNQVNGGDEWWTLKIDGEKLVPFESVTFCLIIQRGEFRDYVRRLRAATPEQCRRLDY
jgi:hypothetical protein